MDPMFEDLLKTFNFGKNKGMGQNQLNSMMMGQLLGLEVDMLKKVRATVSQMIERLEANRKTGGATPNADMFNDDMNPFVILGVKPGASRDEVEAAYKRKARECHPDHGGSNEDMVKVNVAYEAMKRFFGWS